MYLKYMVVMFQSYNSVTETWCVWIVISAQQQHQTWNITYCSLVLPTILLNFKTRCPQIEGIDTVSFFGFPFAYSL